MKSSKPIARHASERPAQRSYSFKLPRSLADRLEALLGLHPPKSRVRIMGDLLRLGMDEFERQSASAPVVAGVQSDATQPVYLPSEPFSEFRRLNYRHHLAMEYRLAKEEQGAQNPGAENTLGEAE